MTRQEFQRDRQFLQSLLPAHMAWHMARMGGPNPNNLAQQGTPGSGLEFLRFHRQLIGQYDAWRTQNLASVLPPGNRRLKVWFPSAVTIPSALQGNLPTTFSTQDALGISIENGIHISGHALHAEITDPTTAPLSHLFWAWHKWIDDLWTRGLQQNPNWPPGP